MRAFGEMRRSPPRPAAGDAFPKAAGAVSNARPRKGTLEMRPNQLSVMVTLPEVANHHRAVLFISPPSNREQTIGADWNLGQGCGI
ncbi:MAG: hypothetical protein QOF90_316 [Acetobacteraceae bacterium]|nr:hypothetical protein [Acetobacteraceae bacterium]